MAVKKTTSPCKGARCLNGMKGKNRKGPKKMGAMPMNMGKMSMKGGCDD